jgi:hypothetical protein
VWEQWRGSGTGRDGVNAHNLRVVRTTAQGPEPALSVTDVSQQAPEMKWEQQSETVRERYTRVGKLPLSAFGKGDCTQF